MNAHIIDNGAPTGGAIMPRATAEAIVARRNAALTAYGEAYKALVTASASLENAVSLVRQVAARKNSYNHHLDAEKASFLAPLKLDKRDDYLATARRMIDTDAWSHVIEITDLENLMDKTAKEQLRQQLLKDPPEFTLDNLEATMRQLFLDRGIIFKRGIAKCFSELDRRFRSHDGWKIGSRIILSRMYDENGWHNFHRNHEDSLIDVERVFRTIDGNPANYCEILGKLRQARGHGAHQTEVCTQYFTLRVFKNGNAHLWFKRDDLVAKVNQLLGEHYGAPIPEERGPVDDGGLFNPKLTPAKQYGFYPTPNAACEWLRPMLHLYREKGTSPLRILEPSAGTGQLARICLGYNADECSPSSRQRLATDRNRVDIIEIQPALANALRQEGVYNRVTCADFLQVQPNPADLYDLVVMNPPFDLERDIDHVVHALKFLKPTGTLFAIMSAGTEFRENRKTIAFREMIAKLKGDYRDLPERSFVESGTYCNTILLKVHKSGASTYW